MLERGLVVLGLGTCSHQKKFSSVTGLDYYGWPSFHTIWIIPLAFHQYMSAYIVSSIEMLSTESIHRKPKKIHP